LCAGSALLLVAIGFAAAHETRQLGAGEKATVTGAILSRNGDLIYWVLDKKSSEIVVVNINDNTKIERKQHHVVFFRHTDMDVTSWSQGVLGLGFSTRPVSVAESWQVEARHSDANLITDATTDYGTTKMNVTRRYVRLNGKVKVDDNDPTKSGVDLRIYPATSMAPSIDEEGKFLSHWLENLFQPHTRVFPL
jgi:hypothetical protein